jgi:putative chromate ion transporter
LRLRRTVHVHDLVGHRLLDDQLVLGVDRDLNVVADAGLDMRGHGAAVWGMTRTLTPDRARAMIALAAIVVVVIVAGSFGQIAAIALGAVAGLRLCRGEPAQLSGQLRFPVSRRGGMAALVVFAALFLVPLVISGSAGQAVALFEAFYRSGALVFGGGHVVLPLLQAQVVAPHWVTNETFLAGYGLAQAVPGPLFTFAAYLGAVMEPPPPNGVTGSAIALVAIFLPGMLLVYGMLPFWENCALANSFKRPCAARTLLSSVSLGWPSTTQFGQALSSRHATSRWPSAGSYS